MSKPKPADIQALPELLRMLQSTRDTAQAAIKLGEAVQISVDATLEDGREQIRKHLERKDLRPKALFKQLPKNVWALNIGASTYMMAPRPNFADLDEEEPRFQWLEAVPDGVEPTIFFAPSMFQALMAVVLHFCNSHEVVTGSVIKPVDNLTT